MLDGMGDLLLRLAAVALYPALWLPVATLAFRRRPAAQAAFWAALALAAPLVAYAFATAAVDLTPRAPSPTLLAMGGAALVIGAALIARNGAARFADGVSRAVSPIIRGIARIAFVAVLAMAFVEFGVVVLRYAFGLSFIAMQESVSYLNGAIFLLAGGYALLTGDHVRVDIFYGRASEARRALIDLLGAYVFLFPFCLLTLWTAAPYVANSWAVREGSAEQSGVQAIFLLKTLIPTFATLLAAAGFVAATRAAAIIRGEAHETAPAEHKVGP